VNTFSVIANAPPPVIANEVKQSSPPATKPRTQ
jgi:hypothetical protein